MQSITLATSLLVFPKSERRVDLTPLSSRACVLWPVPRFENWLIFYRIDDETLTVVRVLHGARELPAALDE